MKINYFLGGLFLIVSSFSFGQELLPDQNPNYKSSQQYYIENSATLTANEGETVQDTYVAYDWTRVKEEKKQERIDRHYQYRMMRFEARNRCCNYNQGYYGNSYNNYNPYYNNYYTPYNYNLAPYLIGAGLYSLFF